MLNALAKLLPTQASAPVEIRAWEDGELSVSVHQPATVTRPRRINVLAHDGEPAWVLQDLHAWVLDTPQPVTAPRSVAGSAQLLIDHCNQPRSAEPASSAVRRAAAIKEIRRWIAREDLVLTSRAM